MRIGHGYDVHGFGPGDHLVVGGVRIPHDRGVVAHSDGDVLIHALCDALLGAAALGDMGRHFPDTDPRYKGIDSRELLRHVAGLLAEKNLAVGNVDITLIAQAPRMASHLDEMKTLLAEDLACRPDRLNIKATTTEKLGFEGRGEGIACHAVVVVEEV